MIATRSRCDAASSATLRVALALAIAWASLAAPPLSRAQPVVIAHRGASGYRPEHTAEAYRLAVDQGADFIEPDLVVTRDGQLVARHENLLSLTTDVARRPEFADRRTTKVVDGVPVTGWFSEDFTLAEIRTLRAVERFPDARPGAARYDGRFAVMTLDEVVALARDESARVGRPIGIYPELKHPTYFAHAGRHLDGSPIGRDIGALLVDRLVELGFTDPQRVLVQCFEIAPLVHLQDEVMPAHGVDLPLMQLMGDLTGAFVPPESDFSRPFDVGWHAAQGGDLPEIYGELSGLVSGGLGPETGYGELTSDAVLAWMKRRYAEGIAPWKDSLLLRGPIDPPVDADGDGRAEIRARLTGATSDLVARARAAGLRVHPYTLRSEERFRVLDVDGTPITMEEEARRLLALGTDGYFTDHPDLGIAATRPPDLQPDAHPSGSAR